MVAQVVPRMGLPMPGQPGSANSACRLGIGHLGVRLIHLAAETNLRLEPFRNLLGDPVHGLSVSVANGKRELGVVRAGVLVHEAIDARARELENLFKLRSSG